MAKEVIIDNITFPFEFGVKILKHRHKNSGSFERLKDIWEGIPPLTFQEALSLRNIEQRRVAIGTLGIQEVVKQLSADLVHYETLHKVSMYINPKGELVQKSYDDTYELYKIKGELLWSNSVEENNRRINAGDVYFVKCYCTSTHREYLIWVDADGVRGANSMSTWGERKEINSIQAIAWTIQTNVPHDSIEKIIRQGDCIFVKPFPKYYKREGSWKTTRHLTEKEYRKLLVAES